jgi:1,2-diacylglycerol 3-alpha-glucosyltransferase
MVEWKPDVIHSQCEFFSLRFAKYISRKTGAPIVHTYHTMYEDYVGYVFFNKRLGKLVARRLTKRILEKVDSVIVPTEKVKERHLKNGIKCDFNVVPSGINLEQHKEPISVSERSRMRLEYGVQDDEVLLLNLGRLATEKNVNELINYYKKAYAENPKIKFLIVGYGPAKESLEKQVNDLGLCGRVIFAGAVKPEEVHKYYRLGDIFVSASTSETQGLTYIEAAANRLPLLCRRDQCLDGVIAEGENGYEYETEEQFIEFLRELSADAEKRRIFGERSQELIKPYDKSVFAESVEKVYESAIRKKCEESN